METRGSLQQQMSRHNSRLIAWHFTRIAFGQSTAWAHISTNSTTVNIYCRIHAFGSSCVFCSSVEKGLQAHCFFFLYINQACCLSLYRLYFTNSLAVKLHPNIFVRSTFRYLQKRHNSTRRNWHSKSYCPSNPVMLL